jgi:hypothetical protein
LTFYLGGRCPSSARIQAARAPPKYFKSVGHLVAWRSFSRICIDGGIVIFDGGSDFNDAVSNSDCDGVGSVESPKLLDGGVDVLVDGTLGDMKNFANLPGGLALRHPRHNLTLTRREWCGSRLGSIQGHAPGK